MTGLFLSKYCAAHNCLQVNHNEHPSHTLPYSFQNSAWASLPALAVSWTSRKPTARHTAEPQRHIYKSQRTLESTKQHPPKQASEQRIILVIRLPPDGHSWNTIEEQKPRLSLDWSSLPLVTKPHVHKLDALCSTRSRQLVSPRLLFFRIQLLCSVLCKRQRQNENPP